jgi:ketosteroid isomerase-like protein
VARNDYGGHQALDPFFRIILEGLAGLVEGEHFFDTFAANARFDSLYELPGWPAAIRGRAGLVHALSGYGANIQLESSDGLVVHRTHDPNVVILEYAVHGTVVATGKPYDNRFISVITLANKKIVHWRDYMDSFAAWRALSGA